MLSKLEVGKKYINGTGQRVEVLDSAKNGELWVLDVDSNTKYSWKISRAKKHWKEIPKVPKKVEIEAFITDSGTIVHYEVGSFNHDYALNSNKKVRTNLEVFDGES